MAEIASDRKAERLINLTMALLASPRYMSKSEIFEKVSGYDGDEETKSRKFERDKDELRTLGIALEVGTNDAYFEDEQGYKISRDAYALALRDISPEEYSLISVAISMWRNQFLSANGQSALRKIQSLDIENVEPLLPRNLFADEVPHQYFDDLWQAITRRQNIEFNYHSNTIKRRSVSPYSLTLWHSFWYLTGFDSDAGEIRTFKVLRMLDGVEVSKKENAFVIPDDFSAKDYLRFQEQSESITAEFSIRKGSALSLRLSSEISQSAGEWDSAQKSYADLDAALRDLVMYGDDVRVDGPPALRSELLARISRDFSKAGA